MVALADHGLSGILADDMGLGERGSHIKYKASTHTII